MTDERRRPERDHDGMGALYRQYAGWLRSRLTRRYGGDAEDLVQETYLRVEPYSRANEIRHPKALLMRIASNVAVDVNRKRRREYDIDVWEEGEDWRSGAGGGQSEQVLLKQIILSMPPKMRDVFLLSRFGGLSYDAISERLGLPVKTVEWRMSKALAHCASKMRD